MFWKRLYQNIDSIRLLFDKRVNKIIDKKRTIKPSPRFSNWKPVAIKFIVLCNRVTEKLDFLENVKNGGWSPYLLNLITITYRYELGTHMPFCIRIWLLLLLHYYLY